MAKPIPATPTLAGEDAEAVLADLARRSDPECAERNAKSAETVRRVMRGEGLRVHLKEGKR